MRINHNSMALNASDHFGKVNRNIAKSMERLSSGYKITSPADDAAGLAISVKLSAQIRGLDRASLNANDGTSVIQSAEGGLSEVHSILQRMRELSVQAANDVNSEEDRDAIQEEINNLIDEIDQIADTTAFNDQKLLNGDMNRRTMSSNFDMEATYISEEVNVGVYELEVTTAATQATYATGFSYSGATVTEEQAGTIIVNNFHVEITEGMTMEEVYGELQTHLSKIDIDVIASNDGGVTQEEFNTGAPVIFKTRGYGSDQRVEIDIENDELAALLGVADGDLARGTDCEASLTVSDEGFSNTASLTTDGNDIYIVDRGGFEMNVRVEPEATGTTEIEVLTAGPMVIQTGFNSGEQLELDIPPVTSYMLGVDDVIMYTHEYASEAVTAIDLAIEKVSNIRAKLGAYENRLEDIYDTLEVQEESITAAYSRIMDTNMAEEMTNYTQQDVLSQAAISMMQKSNERPESILQLLQ
ncbi:MAG: flagellin [Lachnospiraceae bacterium]|nr:flagellin [Lachnospiraceae bacterium]